MKEEKKENYDELYFDLLYKYNKLNKEYEMLMDEFKVVNNSKKSNLAIMIYKEFREYKEKHEKN